MAVPDTMNRRGSARVLELIEWMADQPASFALSQAVHALGWPKSSVLLLLRLLVDRGYAVKHPDNTYILERLPGEPSAENPAWGMVLRVAEPILEEAVAATMETGCIGVLTPEGQLRYLTKVLPQREIRYDRDISRTRTPHHTASGLMLLAGLAPTPLEHYLATIDGGPDEDPEAIRTIISEAARKGCAINLRGRIEGAAGVAAPIVAPGGRFIAALNISGPRERFQKNFDHVLETTIDAAGRASAELARRYSISSTRRSTP